MAPTSPMRFRNYGGIHQFAISDEHDLAHIDALDPARWAATSAPLADLHCDPAFLAALDPAGTGRIRVAQIVEARDWLFARLKRRDGLKSKSDVLILEALDTSTEAGQKLRAAAEDLIRQHGLAGGAQVSLAAVRAYRAGFQKVAENGDGVVPVEVAREPEVQQLLKDIIATTGGAKDVCGADGAGQAELDKFLERAKAWLEWRGKSAGVSPWGADTEAAAALVAGLDAKIEEYFLHCELLRQEQKTAESGLIKDEDLRALRLRDAAALATYLTESPIATPTPAAVLSLGGAPGTGSAALGGHAIINPIYRDRFDELRIKVLARALGPAGELTRASWRKVRAIFEPIFAWQKDQPAEPFDALGEPRVKEILEGRWTARLCEYIALDKAAAPRLEPLADLEKLVLLQRWLIPLANNFVNFSSIFDPKAHALVDMGSLVIDGRRLEFCLKVTDRGGHRKVAIESLIYLIYVAVTEKDGAAPVYEIVAPVTAGERGRLRVGKRGIFIDNDGKEWDAQVTEIVENAISVREATLLPFRKVSQLVGKKLNEWLSSAQQSHEKALLAQADKSAATVQHTTEATVKDVADGKDAAKKAEAAPAPEKAKGLDVNSLILGGGIALGGVATVFGAVFGLLGHLSGWLSLLGVVAAVLALSAFLGWLKLRQRDLGLLLEASGWALNLSMKVNRRVARVFTFTPDLPPGSVKEHVDILATAEDRAEDTRRLLFYTVVIVAVLAVLYWFFGMRLPHPEGLEPFLRQLPEAK